MLDSDLIYEPKAITSLLECKYDSAILTTPVKKFQDSYFVEEDKKHRFIKWSKNHEELNACGELIGIHKLSNKFFKEVCREFEANLAKNEKLSYESFFQKVSNTICPIYILKVDDLIWYEIDDEADLKVAEESVRIEHKRHSYHTTVMNMLKSPFVCYHNERYLGHNASMDKENARFLINTLAKVFADNGIDLILAYGTLLGAIREHDFIGHDGDMDTQIWGRDMQKALDLAPELSEYGIKLECYVLPWIMTYSYKGITCDIDMIYDAVKPLNKRYCLIESQYIQRDFFEHTKKIEFQGQQHIVPANTEKLLEYYYGKTWRIPGGPSARLQSKLFFWKYADKFIRRVKRYVKRRLDKENIQFSWNQLAGVLNNMKAKGIESFTLSEYVNQFKVERSDVYASWLKKVANTSNPELIIYQQLSRYLHNQHGNIGIQIVDFDGNFDSDNIVNSKWIWLED